MCVRVDTCVCDTCAYAYACIYVCVFTCAYAWSHWSALVRVLLSLLLNSASTALHHSCTGVEEAMLLSSVTPPKAVEVTPSLSHAHLPPGNNTTAHHTHATETAPG